ncbi:MAG: ABC transporter permease [Nocardioidaceae bacterium]
MTRTLQRSAGPAPTAAVGRVPLLILIPAVGGLAVLLLPLIGLFVRAPWTDLGEYLTSTEVTTALRLSLVTATISMLVCLVLGTPLAWLLARVDFRGRQFVRALVTVPLVLPPVVGGIALLTTFGRRGVLGEPIFDAFGYQVTFTTTAVVVAQTFVALPFLVLAVEGALRSTDPRYDEVAASLGASRWWTFVRVTLPLAGPGIISGAVLAWARALGEFGATITFAGNFEGVTRTMPLEVYNTYQTDAPGAIVVSLLLLAVSIGVLAALRERWISGVSP